MAEMVPYSIFGRFISRNGYSSRRNLSCSIIILIGGTEKKPSGKNSGGFMMSVTKKFYPMFISQDKEKLALDCYPFATSGIASRGYHVTMRHIHFSKFL